jgi:hypothetical protein
MPLLEEGKLLKQTTGDPLVEIFLRLLERSRLTVPVIGGPQIPGLVGMVLAQRLKQCVIVEPIPMVEAEALEFSA